MEPLVPKSLTTFCGQEPAKSGHLLSEQSVPPVPGLPFPRNLPIPGFSVPSASCLSCGVPACRGAPGWIPFGTEQELPRARAPPRAPFAEADVGGRISWQIRILLTKKGRTLPRGGRSIERLQELAAHGAFSLHACQSCWQRSGLVLHGFGSPWLALDCVPKREQRPEGTKLEPSHNLGGMEPPCQYSRGAIVGRSGFTSQSLPTAWLKPLPRGHPLPGMAGLVFHCPAALGGSWFTFQSWLANNSRFFPGRAEESVSNRAGTKGRISKPLWWDPLRPQGLLFAAFPLLNPSKSPLQAHLDTQLPCPHRANSLSSILSRSSTTFPSLWSSRHSSRIPPRAS